jgi:hypothetical protein
MAGRRWPELWCRRRSPGDLKEVVQLSFGHFERKEMVAKGEMAPVADLL